MNIDFTKTLEEWLSLIREFLVMVDDFFTALGIKIFDKKGENTEE